MIAIVFGRTGLRHTARRGVKHMHPSNLTEIATSVELFRFPFCSQFVSRAWRHVPMNRAFSFHVYYSTFCIGVREVFSLYVGTGRRTLMGRAEKRVCSDCD